MAHVKIISHKEAKQFDTPPEFNYEERKKFFHLAKWVIDLIGSFKTPANQVGFILQFGYFKAQKRFFSVTAFHQKDIEFVANQLGIHVQEIKIESYSTSTAHRHQAYILKNMGFTKFCKKGKSLLLQEAHNQCARQIKPGVIFTELLNFLSQKRIETPGYHTFASVITKALRDFEKKLIVSLEKNLCAEDIKLLDDLLEFDENYVDGGKSDLKIKRYKLTLLKKSHQSTKPAKIKENVQDLQNLSTLFCQLEPVIDALDMPAELIQQYANAVVKSQVFQTKRNESKRYLRLVAFVSHQYFRLNDILIEILMKSVQKSLNSAEKKHKENIYTQRKSQGELIQNFSKKITPHFALIKDAKKILFDENLFATQKIEVLKRLFTEDFGKGASNIEKSLQTLSSNAKRVSKNEDYYEILNQGSLSLQARVSDIVKSLDFDEESSNTKLIEAINYYKKRDGKLNNEAPLGFLDPEERKMVLGKEKKLKVSLYKILLFRAISTGLRCAALNLKHSYKYRSLDDYMIPKSVWDAKKDDLLESSGLLEFKDYSKLQNRFTRALDEQFKITNENLIQGKNKYASTTKTGTIRVATPKNSTETSFKDLELFPKNQFFSLFEVLSTVNQASQFLESFEHWQIKHNREKPADKTFIAGVVGYGCNLGIRKTAKISKSINSNELENTINWYFTPQNLLSANDKILAFMDKLQLHRVYKQSDNVTHTSSDGQKFNIAVESLNAGYSYKYFGKSQGVSVCGFIDESHRLFYSTVIHPSEREAAYVIDGLMHNDVVKSDIHSTDTHGYNEMIFGATHLLGISFAPRIKNFTKQQLYCFDRPSLMKSKGYRILPKKRINTTIIQENWDDILRFIATIKLKRCTASQMFKRLSSYALQHPLYTALKQFGCIVKTLFLLKYIDDVELRQMIEKQLNKIESANKFGKAVYHGNNQEFLVSTKEEQLIAEGCKRLIENAIICWNYMYLTNRLCSINSQSEKSNLLARIKQSSVVAWQHINMQGEYDFSEDALKNSIKFRVPELLKLKIA